MNYIFVKQGEHAAAPHDDFIELVNYKEDTPCLQFWKLIPPGLRLVRNATADKASNPFAIAHYVVDPTKHIQSPKYLKSIDTWTLLQAASKYSYVIAGIVAPINSTPQEQSLDRLRYLARTDNKQLIDVVTGEVIDDTKPFAITSLFGFVQVNGLPMYYMILNHNLVRVTDNIDMYQPETNITWVGLTATDGSLAQRLFAPTATGAKLIDSTIVASSSTFVIDIFGSPDAFLHTRPRTNVLSEATHKLDTNLTCNVHSDGRIDVIIPNDVNVGYIDLQFDCGMFFNASSPREHFRLKFIVYRNYQ